MRPSPAVLTRLALILLLPACAPDGSSAKSDNAPPAAPRLEIRPAEPTTTDELRAVVVADAEDPDGDTVTYTFEWTKDGTVQPDLTGETVPARATRKGELWSVRVTARDDGSIGGVGEASVRVGNSLPVVTVALTPSAPDTRADVRAVATATDADDDDVTMTYVWEKDGAPQGIAEAALDPAVTTRGDVWTVVVTPHDGEEAGQQVRASVTIRNAPPGATSVSLPADPRVGRPLRASVLGAEDPDGDVITYEYAWYLDEWWGTFELVQSGDSDVLAPALYARQQIVRVEVTPTDGTDRGPTLVSEDVEVLNGLPSGTRASIEPDVVTKATGATCVPVGWADPDDDPAQWDFGWTRNNASLLYPSPFLPGSEFEKGTLLSCSATPYDWYDSGVPLASTTVQVANSAPTLAAVNLSTLAPTEADVVTATLVSLVDLDGADVASATYAWFVNDTQVATTLSLSGALFLRGDRVRVEVTPTDGTDRGAVAVSSTATVANSPPAVEAAQITPATPRAGASLSCAAVGWSDLDGDAQDVSYTWFINGTEVGTGAVLAGGFEGGDVVTCTVMPHDGYNAGATRSASVTVSNTAPTLVDVSVTSSLGVPRVGAMYTCVPGTTTDPDGTSAFTYTYAWYLDGAPVSGEGAATFVSGGALRGHTVQCAATPSDGFDTGAAVRSSVTMVQNTPPALVGTTISPVVARVGDTLSCNAGTVSDADGDVVTVSYRWLRADTVLGTGPTLSSGFVGRQAVVCEATPHDGIDSGSAATSNITITNTAPTMTAVRMTPSAPTAADAARCETVGFSDADGDTDQSTFVWAVNGSVVGAGPTLSGAFRYGDTLTCTGTASDGDLAGPSRTLTVAVANAAPVVQSVSVAPAAPLEGDTLTCTPGTTVDADGTTTFTYAYTWRVNGGVVSTSGSTLTSVSFNRGDVVTCSVSASDGVASGASATSANVTIRNTVPAISGVTISPDVAYAGTPLTCEHSGFADADGDADHSTYAWTVDGVAAGSGSVLSNGYRRGQVVACAVTPNDGTGSGTTKSSAITIQNSAPSLASATISPANASAADTLTCVAAGYTDADGDPAANTFAWTRNGGAAGSGSTYGGTRVRGDSLVCVATPFDGTTSGSPVTSGARVLQNAPPTAPGVSVTPAAATDGQSLTCSVSAASTDVDGDSITYTYAWSVNGAPSAGAGASATLSSALTTPGDTWTCTVTASDGTASAPGSASATICVAGTYYVDGDGDGYGRASGSVSACSAPSGYVSQSGDCNDSASSAYPGAFEGCDSVDNDCDGSTDEDAVDADADGWRVCDHDCDDGNAFVNPGYAEICENGVDDDCNGDVDIADVDGDGYLGCGEEDCNDAAAGAHPGGVEVEGDLLDNDCDGEVDSFTADDDDDGYTEAEGDCDDAAPWIHPGATEIPDDEEDQDCDGYEDYAVDFVTTGMGIFVDAAVGDDFFTGTQAFPVRTIARGVALAGANVPVFVAEGSYTEDITLNAGVSLYGGYDASWSYVAGRSEIDGTVTSPKGTTRRDVLARFDVLDGMEFAGDGNVSGVLYNMLTVYDSIIRTEHAYTMSTGSNAQPLLARVVVYGPPAPAWSTVRTLAGYDLWPFGEYVVASSTVVGGIAADGAAGVAGAVGAWGTCGTEACGGSPAYNTVPCLRSENATPGADSMTVAVAVPARVMNSMVLVGVAGDGGDGGSAASVQFGKAGSGGAGGDSVAYGLGTRVSSIFGRDANDSGYVVSGSLITAGHSGVAGDGGNGGNSVGSYAVQTSGGSLHGTAYGEPGSGGNGGISVVAAIGGKTADLTSVDIRMGSLYGAAGGGGSARGTSGAMTGSGTCTGIAVSGFWTRGAYSIQNGVVGGHSLYGIRSDTLTAYRMRVTDGSSDLPSVSYGVALTHSGTINSARVEARASGTAVGVDCLACSTTSVSSSIISADAARSDAVRGAGTCVMTNSVAVGRGASGVAVNFACTDSTIVGNTIVSMGDSVVAVGTGAGALVNNVLVGSTSNTCLVDGLATRTYYRSNLFYACPSRLVYDAATAAYRTTIAAVNFVTASVAYGNNIAADPMFTDAAGGDFTIPLSSPAVNAGYNASSSALGNVTMDILGRPRPARGAYDIGAYEVQ
jgi:hypothetical protein